MEINAHNKAEYQPAHTAEHLLNQTMVRMFGCERSQRSHVERKKSKLDYELPFCPSPEQVAEVERRVNEQIDRHLDVTMEFVARDAVPPEVSLAKLPAASAPASVPTWRIPARWAASASAPPRGRRVRPPIRSAARSPAPPRWGRGRAAARSASSSASTAPTRSIEGEARLEYNLVF